MGLDMYLERINRKAIKYANEDVWIEDEEKNGTELYQAMKPFLVNRGSENYQYKSLSEEIGYWRKDNHIHRWFVENVQNGVDDCGVYEVSKNQIKELKSICQQVIAASTLVDGKIYNGTSWTNGIKTENWEDGKIIEDSSVAEELLPTQSGFFFGGTEYDEYYYASLRKTIEFIDKALETDFENYAIRYASSW